MPSADLTPKAIARFWQRVRKTDTCWIWEGGSNSGGYGQVKVCGSRRRVYAHRLAWEIYYGEPPKGLVLHTRNCKSKLCVKKEHLYEGTLADNMQDTSACGRLRTGESNGTVRYLTPDYVREIRSRAVLEKHRNLATEFNVSEACISNVVNRKTWRWVE